MNDVHRLPGGANLPHDFDKRPRRKYTVLLASGGLADLPVSETLDSNLHEAVIRRFTFSPASPRC